MKTIIIKTVMLNQTTLSQTLPLQRQSIMMRIFSANNMYFLMKITYNLFFTRQVQA